MPSSSDSFLKKLWEELKTGEYKSVEFELHPHEKEMIATLLENRNHLCMICGRRDFMNFTFMLSGKINKLLSIHVFCPCGMRLTTISITKAILETIKEKKQPIQLNLEDLLRLSEKSENIHKSKP